VLLPVLAMVRKGFHIKQTVAPKGQYKGVILLQGEEKERFVLYEPKFCIV
jgi:hypothetical protein